MNTKLQVVGSNFALCLGLFLIITKNSSLDSVGTTGHRKNYSSERCVHGMNVAFWHLEQMPRV